MSTLLTIILVIACILGWLLALVFWREAKRWEASAWVFRKDYFRTREEALGHFRAELRAHSELRELKQALRLGEITYRVDGVSLGEFVARVNEGMYSLKEITEALPK